MQFTKQAILGCIVAGAAGDALGGLAERKSRGLSDDTQLTLATCEAILEIGAPEPKAIADRMRAGFVAGEITGVGSSTLKALRDLAAGAHWALSGARGERAAGNGAAMRAAPLAFFLDPGNSADRVRLRDIARITHHHDEAYIGSLAVVVALRRAAAALDWSNESIGSELPDSRVRDYLLRAAGISGIAPVVAEVGSSGFVAETIPVAFELARLMRSAGFEAAMAEMNALGGDADTIGSIAGQIWGTETSIAPAPLLNNISGAERVMDVADRFARFAAGEMR